MEGLKNTPLWLPLEPTQEASPKTCNLFRIPCWVQPFLLDSPGLLLHQQPCEVQVATLPVKAIRGWGLEVWGTLLVLHIHFLYWCNKFYLKHTLIPSGLFWLKSYQHVLPYPIQCGLSPLGWSGRNRANYTSLLFLMKGRSSHTSLLDQLPFPSVGKCGVAVVHLLFWLNCLSFHSASMLSCQLI